MDCSDKENKYKTPFRLDKLWEYVQNDLKNISLETKRKFPTVKEAAEEAIVKIRAANLDAIVCKDSVIKIFQTTNHVLFPLAQGCETKDAKIIKLCLSLLQRLIVNKVVDFRGVCIISDTLWMLMESTIEEVKILQTITLLVSSSHSAQNDSLSKCIVICFRLCHAKDQTTKTIAGATVRQLIPAVFERVGIIRTERDRNKKEGNSVSCELCLHHCIEEEPSAAYLEYVTSVLPNGRSLSPFFRDAFFLARDVSLLVSGEQPEWLKGLMEMSQSFGLELLETILSSFQTVFSKYPEFRRMLKERVCSLVIRLFSPNIKNVTKSISNQSGTISGSSIVYNRPHFPITIRLLRVVSILILDYHEILITETEIFISLVLKFLDPDKPSWQNCVALEVIHKILVRPLLLSFLCRNFDMVAYSSNIFQDIINTLGAFVQTVMCSTAAAASEEPEHVSSSTLAGSSASYSTVLGSNNSSKPGFYFRNIFKPLTITFMGGHAKDIYLQLSEKSEQQLNATVTNGSQQGVGGTPPILVSDGYAISLTYVCLLDTVRSISLLIKEDNKEVYDGLDKDVKCKLLSSSWCGLLTALSLLLDASTDDGPTETILNNLESFSAFCGGLDIPHARDAFLATICKASLPPHYTLSVLKTTASPQIVSGPSKFNVSFSEIDGKHQVVAVGTPLPTSSLTLSAHNGPVMLTSKNLQCMRSILNVAQCHGDMLGPAWHIVLTSIQHLVWILGLSPTATTSTAVQTGITASSCSTSGSSSIIQCPISVTAENNPVITTAVLADLPILSSMVTSLFESSAPKLMDASILYLIESLCTLSEESMELASSNREPSLFAIAKILETSLANLAAGRIDIIWKPVVSHLLIVTNHPHVRMRQWGCEALTFLIKQALLHEKPVIHEDGTVNPTADASQTVLLTPLAELSTVRYADIRQKQLDTVLYILHAASPTTIRDGWPIILTTIGTLDRSVVDNSSSDVALVRSAFQCLQLIFTDYLPSMPRRCYPLCVETAAKFSGQNVELNVSLTAIGLLWNLSDYFYQNAPSLSTTGSGSVDEIYPQTSSTSCSSNEMTGFDRLWMCLFGHLHMLCLDDRPSVRKSAGQTLFSTIAAHGSSLERSSTWSAVLWRVMFPLLDSVIEHGANASADTIGGGQSDVIVIHHSRNTAQKQWAETKVLTISGVVRVFNNKRQILKTSLAAHDYGKAWTSLLGFIERMAISGSTEVCVSALKAMQELISMAEPNSDAEFGVDWRLCWLTWINIGRNLTFERENQSITILTAVENSYYQILLTDYVNNFIQLFSCLQKSTSVKFNAEDVSIFGDIILACVKKSAYWVGGSVEMPPADPELISNQLSPLHTSVVTSLNKLIDWCNKATIPSVFKCVLMIGRFTLAAADDRVKQLDRLALLGEICMERLGSFYAQTFDQVKPEILAQIVSLLHLPLRRKYACSRRSNWKIAINVLDRILRLGIPLARNDIQANADIWQPFWDELSCLLESFLFPASCEQQRPQDRLADESVDVHLVELMKKEVLAFPLKLIPTVFIRKLVLLLNRGSIHSSIGCLNEECSSGKPTLREDFAKTCFETLLEFSLLSDVEFVDDQAVATLTSRMALTSILQRFHEVLVEAIEADKLNRDIPMERIKVIEIVFVLKAIATVVSSMKRATLVSTKFDEPRQEIDARTWEQVIGLYPYLVQFTDMNSLHIGPSVKTALLEYKDLLHPFETSIIK